MQPSIIDRFNDNILEPLIMLIFALGVGYFLFGVMKFVLNQDNEEAQEEGKKHMLWGIVGIAIMASVWGILALVNSVAKEIY